MVRTWVVGEEEIHSGSSTLCLDWEVGRVRGAGTREDGAGEDVDVGEPEEAGTRSQWEERWDRETGPPTRKRR
jgi:hypothetical protein